MSIATSPAYPLPGETVTLSRTGGAGSYTEFELTSRPSTSSLPLGILRNQRGAAVDTFVPDVQGAYVFRALEYVEVSGAAAGFPGDVAGTARRELRGSQTGTVYVAATMELPIQTIYGHGATLRIRVHGSTVRAAELVRPTTELARIAAMQSTVTAALAALVGVATTPGTLGEEFVADVNTLATRYANHIASDVPVHPGAEDTTNELVMQDAYTIPTAIDRLLELADLIPYRHMRAQGAWHSADDSKNWPIAARTPTLAGAVVMLADLRERVYERHRAQTSAPASHGAADEDSGSAMPDPLPLTLAIVAYLDAIADESPTANSGVQQGVADISFAFGFKLLG